MCVGCVCGPAGPGPSGGRARGAGPSRAALGQRRPRTENGGAAARAPGPSAGRGRGQGTRSPDSAPHGPVPCSAQQPSSSSSLPAGSPRGEVPRDRVCLLSLFPELKQLWPPFPVTAQEGCGSGASSAPVRTAGLPCTFPSPPLAALAPARERPLWVEFSPPSDFGRAPRRLSAKRKSCGRFRSASFIFLVKKGRLPTGAGAGRCRGRVLREPRWALPARRGRAAGGGGGRELLTGGFWRHFCFR